MLTEAFPSGSPSNHELAISRLESFGEDLRSATPPPRFNPRNYAGIELIRVAAGNIKVQQGINRSLDVVKERLETALRFAALQSIEQHDPEPKVFDSFTAADISQLTFFYGAFHQNIQRILGLDIIPIEDVKTLADKHEEPTPKIRSSMATVSQRRESVIDKLQGWLVDPNIDQKMEQLLPTDNQGDDLWLFMDSIRTLDGQLGIKHGINIKDFFRRNLEALGNHTYTVDFSKRGNGVVKSGNNPPIDEVGRRNVEEAEETEAQTASPFWIFKTDAADVSGGVEQRVPTLKAVERRVPDIRQKLGEYLDDVMGRPEFRSTVRGEGLNKVFNRLKSTVLTRLLEDRCVKLEIDKDGHPRYDNVAVATVLYINDLGSQLPSQLKKQIQGIAAEEHRKKLLEKKDHS